MSVMNHRYCSAKKVSFPNDLCGIAFLHSNIHFYFFCLTVNISFSMRLEQLKFIFTINILHAIIFSPLYSSFFTTIFALRQLLRQIVSLSPIFTNHKQNFKSEHSASIPATP